MHQGRGPDMQRGGGACRALAVRVLPLGQQWAQGQERGTGHPGWGMRQTHYAVKVAPELWKGVHRGSCARRVSRLRDRKLESETWAYWLVDDSTTEMGKLREGLAGHETRMIQRDSCPGWLPGLVNNFVSQWSPATASWSYGSVVTTEEER